MGLMDFLSAEAGQKRRRWLDKTVGEGVNYYLGAGTGLTERGAALAELNPVKGMENAGSSARGIVAPNAGVWDRVKAAGDTASAMAGVAAPMGAAKPAGKAADAIMEMLTGASMGPRVAAADFAADEAGALKLYHGSPHDFDKFSMDKIGTGEGAQAYGHGLYFAESEGVAKSYRQALAPGEDPRQGVKFRGAEMPTKNPETPVEMLTLYMRQLGYAPKDAFARAKKTFTPEMLKEIDGLKPDDFEVFMPDKYTGKGKMYEVNVNANAEDFLDWDAPLSAQTQKVRDAVQSAGVPIERENRWYGPNRTRDKNLNENVYWTNNDAFVRQTKDGFEYGEGSPFSGASAGRAQSIEDAQASAPVKAFSHTGMEVFAGKPRNSIEPALREAGVPGIRYKDAGSRGADGSSGTSNYVVFDDSLISILRKYGLAGAAVGATQMQGQDPNRAALNKMLTRGGT